MGSLESEPAGDSGQSPTPGMGKGLAPSPSGVSCSSGPASVSSRNLCQLAGATWWQLPPQRPSGCLRCYREACLS